jgi:hypothetical protein
MAVEQFEYVVFNHDEWYDSNATLEVLIRECRPDNWTKAGSTLGEHVAQANTFEDEIFIHQYGQLSLKYKLAIIHDGYKLFTPANKKHPDVYLFRRVQHLRVHIRYLYDQDGQAVLCVGKADSAFELGTITVPYKMRMKSVVQMIRKSFHLGNMEIIVDGGCNNRLSVETALVKKHDVKKSSAKTSAKKPAAAPTMKKPAGKNKSQ